MKQVGRFIGNGLLLSAVSLFLRAIGVSFQAFLSTHLGAAGIGFHQLLLSVTAPAMTLATAGIHLATSRLVAEEMGKPEGASSGAILKRCFGYALTVSGAIGGLLLLVSELAASAWLGFPQGAPLLRRLAFSLPCVALTAAINGYFNAVRRVSRTAAVQLAEQGIRIGLTVWLLARTDPGDTVACLSAVITASVAADLVACLCLALLCHRDQKRSREEQAGEGRELLPRLLAITLPVSLSSFLRSGLVALEHLLIPRGLRKSGLSAEGAMASYGVLTGMTLPILFFPASFLYAFTGLLIPELSELNAGDKRKEIAALSDRVVGTVLLYGVGCAGVLLAFSSELGIAIYHSEEAGRYLRTLAPLLPIMYLDTAVDSLLKGLGEQVYTMKVNILDAAVSVVAVWLLVPRMGLNGYLAVIIMSEIINFSFSFARLVAVTGCRRVLLRRMVTPLLAAVGGICLAKPLACRLFAAPGGVAFGGIALSLLGYLAFLVLLGGWEPMAEKPGRCPARHPS